MLNKRGISNIVATVLIVLLALGAIALIWGFIGPLITDTGTDVELSTKCLVANTEVKPTNCVVNTTSNITAVTVELMKGDVIDVVGIVEDGAGIKKTGSVTTVPSVLATGTAAVTTTDMDSSTMTATASAEVENEEGDASKLCDPSPTEIPCSTTT